MTIPASTFRAPAKSGFTLLELLVVLTIVGILTVGAIPAIQSLLESSDLTQGGQTFVGQVNLARQIASARNRTVQIRLIQLPSETQGYGGIQLWDASSGLAVAPFVALPHDVVIAQDTTKLSPILNNATTNTMTLAASQASYVYFTIAPSGLVELSGSQGTAAEAAGTTTSSSGVMAKLYASVVPLRFGGGTTVPTNFVTVQLNPDTGTPLVFRP